LFLSVLGRFFGRSQGEPEVPLTELADEDLMLEFGKGNPAAFEILLKRHQAPVFRYILRFISNRAQAEELSQEVFLRVCKVAGRYSKKAKFTTWLYTIARNLCIDHKRRTVNRVELSLERTGEEDDRSLADRLPDTNRIMASSELVRDEFRRKLEEALATLPDEQREVFTMREFSGLKFREIADVLEVSENTVKSRMRYALETLRGHLAAYSDFSFDADDSSEAQHMR